MTDQPVVSVLIVNWNSGQMSRGLVANLARQRLPGLEPGEGLEYIVVDNASGPAEEQHLLALEEAGVTVIRSAQNGGYATGMNEACARATGRFVLMTNPDVMVFRGALATMIEHLESNPGCGMVGPKSYLDSGRFFQLPPTELPSLCNEASEVLARAWAPWGRVHAAGRSRRALAQWTASAPLKVTQLSGFALMMQRELALEMGPFDGRYPLYYEDSDLCMRLSRKGFSCELLPRAEMVHFFNRSAGQAQDASWSRYDISRRRFFDRRYTVVGGWLARGLFALAGMLPGRGHEFADFTALGPHEAVPLLDVPGHGAYIAEISSDAGFVFAAGRLDVSAKFRVPDVVWSGLVDTTYFVRFVDRRTREVRGMYSIEKVGGSQHMDAEVAAAELMHA
ncbi:MAG: GT2 family glycosyltransferase [Pseudohongiellaceae bacterium]|jgi:GT2 family glycosyltransferase